MVGNNLGIGLRHPGNSLFFELSSKVKEVLDDAVVDDGDSAVEGQVGVGILVGWATVGCPPGVSD